MESEFPEAMFDEEMDINEFNIIYDDENEDPDEEDLELCVRKAI